MDCPNCNKPTPSHRAFCAHCKTLVVNPQAGKRTGLLKRTIANLIDYFPTSVILFLWTTELAHRPTWDYSPLVVAGAGLIMLLYLTFLFWLWSDGISPAKRLLNIEVVDRQDGNYVGFWAMIRREIVGKPLSALCLGLGFLWALWDQDGQTWHDKMAGTVVVQRLRQPSSFGDLQVTVARPTDRPAPDKLQRHNLVNSTPVEQLLEQGIAQIQSGDTVSGGMTLRHVVRRSPDNATAWLWMGWIAVGQRDQRIAEICFLQAQRLGHPKAAQILSTLGQSQPKELSPDIVGMQSRT